ncbi:hypothetical protein BJ322DRAFT_1052617 [Thelephora terrestris]|uniref:Uncharacterized protein n=1 Tax=Thelephora terrestris TaxID=56493 RepID=A0A9P6HHK7_9AGAM|nr:hypothetical protein BJ322DRAFT_1052617 [Thelephora terrestris]
MRRAQSVRNHASGRPAFQLTDDMGALTEGDERSQDVLRKKLLETDRENDKLRTQIQALQVQLSQRPSVEAVQELQREYKNLDLLLQGTQRENERCMAELERSKMQVKHLEQALTDLAGPNWKNNIAIPALSAGRLDSPTRPFSTAAHSKDRSSTSPSALTDANQQQTDEQKKSVEAAIAHIEQVKLMILGMDQRLETREAEVATNIKRAQVESSRFEEMRKQVLSASTNS